MKNAHKILALVGMLMAAASPAQTRQELDDREARIKQLNSRGKEFALAHGTYVVIRDVNLNGASGFQSEVKKWFADASKWMSAWETLIQNLNGQNLANVANLDSIKLEVQEQLNSLNVLRGRLEKIRARGVDAQTELSQIPRYSTNYIPNYGEPIKAFNQQLDNLQKQTSLSLGYFSAESAVRMEAMAEKLQQLVNSKAAMLALNYPELENTLREVESALNTIRLVDRHVHAVTSRALDVRKEFLDGRVYSAIANLNKLKQYAKENQALINTQRVIPEVLRANGSQQIQKAIDDLDAEFKSHLNFSPAKTRFVSWYDRQMNNRFEGVLQPCKASVPPKHLDCMLLKTVAGFNAAQLQAMTDGQLEYIEKTLLRVKEGPIHSSTQAGGVK